MLTITHKKFDIGILGVWYGLNYGSVLTYYALQSVLKQMGLSPLMIEKPGAADDDFERRDTHARRFANEHFQTSGTRPLNRQHELNKLCDGFIIGSDQVWNYGISRAFGKTFYLDFAEDNKKKIAYAASFGHGTDFAPEEERVLISRLMKRFDAIAVREDDGVRLCRDVYHVDATRVLDPVFLANPEDYTAFAERSHFHEQSPYMLAYILDTTPEKKSLLLHMSKRLGLRPVIMLDGFGSNAEVNRKILNMDDCVRTKLEVYDWLYFFKNTSYVLTDSFHGMCFSVLFNKQFLPLPNKHRGYSRFRSIANLLDITDRLIMDPARELKDEKFMQPVDYTRINAILDNDRTRCRQWLNDAIEGLGERLVGMNGHRLTHNVTHILDVPRACTGCGTCSAVCPSYSIEMRPDEFGFLRPIIDASTCVDCGLCEKRCPALHPQYKNSTNPGCYAMMAPDEIRKVSSSGGMFTVAAEYVLNQGGAVCGAAYKANFEVEHIVVDHKADLERIRGSKYMQSNAAPAYPRVRELLQQGKTVLFTGMPCQVAGLCSFLDKNYDNLYTMDLVCHGITSSKVFEKYHQEVLGGKKITRLEFKAKQPWGWHAGVNAWFDDGTKYSKPLETDPYFRCYLQSLAKNVACADCTSNRMPRQGDLTIGDFWKIGTFDPSLNDNKGTSLILVNSQKGEDFFVKLKPSMAVVKEAPLATAIMGNRSLEHSYPMNKNREMFFKNFKKINLDTLQASCISNRVYEQEFIELSKLVPPEDQEFYFIAKFAAENYRGRKIVTWARSNKFEKILQRYFGLSVSFGVTMRRESIIKGSVEDIATLKGKSDDYYLVSLDKAYDDGVYKLLASYGYLEKRDFVFRRFKPIVLENLDLSKGNYSDVFGNTIEGFRSTVGKVIFRGFNNHIMFGKDMISARFLTFDLCANSRVDIGERVSFNAPTQIESRGFEYGSLLKIGNDCSFRLGGLFRFYTPSTAIIGDHCTATSNFGLHVNMGKKIIIGCDCMFSFENDLWAGDGHAIFDVKSGKCTNRDMSGVYHPSNHLVIGNHVWVGKQAFLMHGTNIGSGSIVGACSVVKGVFPNNCTIAGNPAIKVKENVAWSRDGMANNLENCGRPEYAILTSPASAPISGRKVLVIGGTRFMGVQPVKELIALGNDVTIATRGLNRDNFGMYVNRLVIDVSNETSVKAALSGKYFDVVFDNLAYCSQYVNNVLSHVKCGKYIQLSSVEAYEYLIPDMKEEYFNPYKLHVEIRSVTAGYIKGKRLAEAIAYQHFKNLSVTTVRIPYVTKTDRLFYYCKNIVNQDAMNIDDVSRGFTFIRDTEVGSFLPWIAAQDFSGPINLASEGMVTIDMILKYIEEKTGKKAIIDTKNGSKSPFHEFNEKTFSMNMNKARQLGYKTSHINDWFWKLMDEYIARALK